MDCRERVVLEGKGADKGEMDAKAEKGYIRVSEACKHAWRRWI